VEEEMAQSTNNKQAIEAVVDKSTHAETY